MSSCFIETRLALCCSLHPETNTKHASAAKKNINWGVYEGRHTIIAPIWALI